MTREDEIELFGILGRGFPQLKEWLRAREAKQLEILRKNKDHAVLLATQGHLAAIEDILKKLEDPTK